MYTFVSFFQILKADLPDPCHQKKSVFLRRTSTIGPSMRCLDSHPTGTSLYTTTTTLGAPCTKNHRLHQKFQVNPHRVSKRYGYIFKGKPHPQNGLKKYSYLHFGYPKLLVRGGFRPNPQDLLISFAIQFLKKPDKRPLFGFGVGGGKKVWKKKTNHKSMRLLKSD